MGDKVEQPSIAALRMKMAMNHFKRSLLGDLHVPGKAQSSTTIEALGSFGDEIKIFDRTWESWFADLFDSAWKEVARPDWSKTGIGLDVSSTHVYKLLFALAADAEFLKADRLQAWSLDIATAALAMHALAWADRYATFDIPITDELIYWIAFDEILFSTTPLNAGNSEVIRAMMRLDADWEEASFGRFQQAREIYQSELCELGISIDDILTAANGATQVHPFEYCVDGQR